MESASSTKNPAENITTIHNSGNNNNISVNNNKNQRPQSSRRNCTVDDDDDDDDIPEVGFAVTETNLIALASGKEPKEMSWFRKREIEENSFMDKRDKKRRLLDSYVTTEVKLPELDRHELVKLKTYVRETIFKNMKFLKGEGSYSVKCRRTRRAINEYKNQYGNSHEKIDLVSEPQTCYAKKILEYMNVSSDTHTWYEIGMWWRMWAPEVKKEIRRVRASRSYAIKNTIQNGEFFMERF